MGVHLIKEINLEVYCKLLLDEKPFLLIDCDGGSIMIAGAILEDIKSKEASACVVGCCNSAALDIFLHCKNRFCLKHAFFASHKVSIDTCAYEEMDCFVDNINKVTKVASIYNNTIKSVEKEFGVSPKELTSRHFTAKEVQAKGICKIITPKILRNKIIQVIQEEEENVE